MVSLLKSLCSDNSLCSDDIENEEQGKQLCTTSRRRTETWRNDIRDSREWTFVSHRGGGLLNSLVNLSLKGCTQLHHTDVVLRKGRTTGLRISPRGPLPLPGGFPRRSISYAGGSGGGSPARPAAQSLCSLDAPPQPPTPLPSPNGSMAASPKAPAAAAAAWGAQVMPLKPAHMRSSSCANSPTGGLGREDGYDGGSGSSSAFGYLHGADPAPAHFGPSIVWEEPCGLRSLSAPSRPCPEPPQEPQGSWSAGTGLRASSPMPMVTERLAFGVSTAIGVRSTMEDFAFALPLVHPSGMECELLQAACFGVFDGHGGADVAQSLAEHVPGRIQENVHHIIEFGPQHIAEVLTGHEKLLRRLSEPWVVESSQPCTADAGMPCAPNLISPCPAWEEHKAPLGRRLQAQAASHQQQQQPQQSSQDQQPQQSSQNQQPQRPWPVDFEGGDPGSTALVVTIVGDRLFCANVGDCRLLVAELDPQTGTVVPRRVTCDHNSQHPGEAARLAALSVSVSADGYVGGQEGWLQVSRSIGDFSVKRALGEEIILSEPELHTLRLTDNILFAVAVSDGITNKLSDETIINQVCRFLSEVPPAHRDAAAAAAGDAPPLLAAQQPPLPPQNNDPHHAASQLVQYAINAADSDDNCAVVVVSFKDTPPPVPRRPRLFQRKALTSGNLDI